MTVHERNLANLLAARIELDWRVDTIYLNKKKEYGGKCYVVTIEDCNDLFDKHPSAATTAERIARQARRCNMRIDLVGDSPEPSWTYQSAVLRDHMSTGRVTYRQV